MHPASEQKLTRSLRSGTDVSQSVTFESGGENCYPAPYSKPYVMCSAVDAASAAIDFTKGNVEDGVVDSPPSRGVGKTPLCSPSPLKRERTAEGDLRLGSSKPCNQGTAHRKLYALAEESVEDIIVADVNTCIQTPIILPATILEAGIAKGHVLCDSAAHTRVHVRPRSSSQQSGSTGSLMSSAGGYHRRILRGAFSLGNRQATKSTMNRLKLTSPSNSDSSSIRYKRKATHFQSHSEGACKALSDRSMPWRASRYEDIMRGREKMKAEEVQKNSSKTSTHDQNR